MEFQYNGVQYGPAPWWTLSDDLERDELIRQMDEMRSKHIYELILYANYGLKKPDFLSDEWFDLIGFLLEEFAKRNMSCWIYDELSWPSGTAGGIIPRDYPEYRMRCLDRSEYIVEPDRSIQLPSGDMVRYCGVFAHGSRTPEKLIPGTVYTNNSGAAVKVTVLEVKLIESVFFHNIGTESTWNQPGQLDALNPTAVRCWMSYIHEKYKARFSNYFGSVVKGFFYDETTMTSVDRTDRIPWTWDLEESFRREYGWPCADNYWKLLYENDEPDSEQFRYDFWRFTGKRFADAFTGQMGRWCAENNLALTGHGWPEEPACQRLMINTIGDLHYQQRHAQVPGTDHLELKNCFSENIAMGGNVKGWARNYIYSAKHAPSTMRYNGGSRSLVEISGICGFSSPLCDQRWVMDFMFSMGINIINSAIGFSLRGFRKYGCCAERAMPYYEYYRDFSDYIARASYFNSQGWLKTDLAVLSPLSSKFSQSVITPDTSMRQENTPFAEGADSCEATLQVLDTLCRRHREFELLFEDVLLEGEVKAGALSVPRSSFKVIILPQAQVIDDAVAEKLAEFTAHGGKVIAVGAAPKRTVRHDKTCRNADLSKVITHRLDFTDVNFADQLEKLLTELSAADYTLSGEGCREVITQLRSDGNRHGLFIYNAVGGDKLLQLDSPALGTADAIFDPGDGKYFAPDQSGRIALNQGQSLICIWDKSLDRTNLPPAAEAMWSKVDSSAVTWLPLQWSIAGTLNNTLRPQLELWHDNGFIAIEDSAFCPFQLDPEQEPYVTLRGRFTVAAQVPADLRLRFDSADFRDLSVNDRKVANPPQQEVIFHGVNVSVNIAEYCRGGENIFTVTVPVSKWYGHKYGIRRHFVNLIRLLELMPLAGSFGVNGNMQVDKVPAVLRAGDLREQSLAQFAGKLCLNSSFDCPENLLSSRRLVCSATAAALRLRLNGCDLGCKLWHYGDFQLPEGLLKRSGNYLEMEITNPFGNLYPRRWDANLDRQLPFTLPELGLF